MDEDSVTKIRQLNDHARCNFADCQIVLTRSVQKLENLDCLFTQIQQFDVFTQANDPYGEHDFGSLRFAGETIFWKIDYYDLDMTMHSPDPSDPNVTARVLTIMLGEEY